MKRRVSGALVCLSLVVLTLGLASPLAAAPPELVINDMDAARAYFDTYEEGWWLSAEVSYVYADFVRYQDGTFARPHTDLDVRLRACPVDSTDPCIELYGTTNLGDMPEAASFTELTEAWVTDATVDVVEVPLTAGGFEGSVNVSLDWQAFGPIRNVQRIDPGVQVFVGKQRDATVVGTIDIRFATGPFAQFVASYGPDYGFVENYNEVVLGR